LDGALSATGSQMAEIKRWSAGRKRQVVLRLLRGESVDALSRELAVPIYRLEEWRERALAGMDVGLKERDGDPVEKLLDDANRRIGELVMEIEILHKERQVKRPLAHRRSSR
jgi:transposase